MNKNKAGLMNITMVGSCFCGFLRDPLARLAEVNFQTHTVWQRLDAVVDIINGNFPDRELVNYYINNGYWERKRPLGIEVEHEIKDSEWFARQILAENEKALKVVEDMPDLLIFDSLSDWRHPLYRNRKDGWKCFLGKILFRDPEVAGRFEKDFEFVQLLDLDEINGHIKAVIRYFKARKRDMKAVYIHFPALAGHLEEKWVIRAEELKGRVALLNREFNDKEFLQLVIPAEIVKPLTDPSHPNYSKDVWNHFEGDVYDYCARRIMDWRSLGVP